MHADQVDVTPDVVRGLVAAQFPQWRDQPVRPLNSHGTVNALFRLGEQIVLRFPLQPGDSPAQREALAREQWHARRIAPQVPVAVPEPVGFGEPGEGYTGCWTACRWIPGSIASSRTIDNLDAFALDLACFVTAVHAMETGALRWDGRSRGGPLSAKDEYVRRCLAESAHLVDTAKLTGQWERCRDAPMSDGPDVWIHADLMPGNLLVRNGKLVAVIDLEAMCVGDPAVDLMPAWNLLDAPARATYRRALGADDALWDRGRGWALLQAIAALPYYEHTNAVMAETALVTLNAILE